MAPSLRAFQMGTERGEEEFWYVKGGQAGEPCWGDRGYTVGTAGKSTGFEVNK